MSHTTSIKTVNIKDRAAVMKAAMEMGTTIEVLNDTVPRMYYKDQHGKCALVLRAKDCPYDVGLDFDAKTGLFTPVFDAWRGHIARVFGGQVPKESTAADLAVAPIGKFLQRYAINAAANAARAKGYFIDGETTDESGNTHLKVRVS